MPSINLPDWLLRVRFSALTTPALTLLSKTQRISNGYCELADLDVFAVSQFERELTVATTPTVLISLDVRQRVWVVTKTPLDPLPLTSSL